MAEDRLAIVQEENSDETKEIKKVTTATDLQRHKLEKLLKDPEKPVYIPERPKERKLPKPPEFIRNTWGSSAGAGSGDFHVYRGVRRREYARQKFLNEQEAKVNKDSEYQQKLEANQKAAAERTAKKRAKRLKKKQKAKQQKKSGNAKPESDSESEEDEEAEIESAEKSDQQPDNNTQNDTAQTESDDKEKPSDNTDSQSNNKSDPKDDER